MIFYPSDDVANTTTGVRYGYDGLQRLTTTTQSGGGSQAVSYLEGNKQLVNNFRGKETTTTYLAYGASAYKQALIIDSPEGVTTSQAINIYGEVTSITQSGGGISQTQTNLYDDRN